MDLNGLIIQVEFNAMLGKMIVMDDGGKIKSVNINIKKKTDMAQKMIDDYV